MVAAPDFARPTISALLGPTNTGKTHRAVERMLEHRSGMLGLPLRLLAREVYDRVTSIVGEGHVALVTGEEKRVPSRPRYWICTVEAMPIAVPTDFLAIDEIQLAAHPERGHVFTSRLLGARGRLETWFLGAETMRPLLSELLLDASFERHPRFSRLVSTGSSGIGGIPPRSAVVAFSVQRVYALAERLQRRRGGTAVVLGALSPRARNAQVAMYQSGEVDYLVATDAIGMGLNLDISHVAFSELKKFDGRRERPLQITELAQIAGRAGRYRQDGSFGTLSPAPPLTPRVVKAIESHRFAPTEELFWRNDVLDFSSIEALVASLEAPPPHPALRRIDRAEDRAVLIHLARLDEVRRLANSPARVMLLWEVCQIPDYRQLMFEAHAELLRRIYIELSSTNGRLSDAWVRSQIARLDDARGDIDTLTLRVSFVRTWSYIANRSNWLVDSEHWQSRTREVEELLSDALHRKLTERFVDPARRTTSIPLLDDEQKRHAIALGPFAQLIELRQAMSGEEGTNLWDWVEQLVDAPHDGFSMSADGGMLHRGEVIARLGTGRDKLHPTVVFLLAGKVGAGAASRIARRLNAWVRDWINELFDPLRYERFERGSGALRGILYQLEQGLGTLRTGEARDLLMALSPDDRHGLRRAGIIVGTQHVFASHLLKPRGIAARRALCVAAAPRAITPCLPRAGAVSLKPDPRIGSTPYTLIGFPRAGPLAVRCDMLEKVGARLASPSGVSDPELHASIASWLGCSKPDAQALAESMIPRQATPRRRRRSSGKRSS